MSFSFKVIIVTGSSSGIGTATALLFSKEQANVEIVGRNESKLEIITAQCEEVGKKPLVIKANVSNDDEAASIIKKIIDKFGKLDILVNNAGYVRARGLLDGKLLAAYGDVIKTNLRAVINLTQWATSHLIKTKENITNISSITGMKQFGIMAYGISKVALNYITQGTALEVADHGVRVNVIRAGPVFIDIFENSKMENINEEDVKLKTMNDRISSSKEVGNMILYLASDKAVGVTGSNFVLDNGALLLN